MHSLPFFDRQNCDHWAFADENCYFGIGEHSNPSCSAKEPSTQVQRSPPKQQKP